MESTDYGSEEDFDYDLEGFDNHEEKLPASDTRKNADSLTARIESELSRLDSKEMPEDVKYKALVENMTDNFEDLSKKLSTDPENAKKAIETCKEAYKPYLEQFK